MTIDDKNPVGTSRQDLSGISKSLPPPIWPGVNVLKCPQMSVFLKFPGPPSALVQPQHHARKRAGDLVMATPARSRVKLATARLAKPGMKLRLVNLLRNSQDVNAAIALTLPDYCPTIYYQSAGLHKLRPTQVRTWKFRAGGCAAVVPATPSFRVVRGQ